MALSIDTMEALRGYFDGVMSRANHHADNVNEIILALVGGVIWRGAEVDVRTYNGKTANMLWMKTDGGKGYCFYFNHFNGKIEVREDGMNGKYIRDFTNTDTALDVKRFFENMK